MIVPTCVVFTVIVTVADAPTARSPRATRTAPALDVSADPWLGVAETSVVPAGSVSSTLTPAAVSGPLFVTVSV